MTASFTQSFRVDWGKVTSAWMSLAIVRHTNILNFKEGRDMYPEVSPGWDLILFCPKLSLK